MTITDSAVLGIQISYHEVVNFELRFVIVVLLHADKAGETLYVAGNGWQSS